MRKPLVLILILNLGIILPASAHSNADDFITNIKSSITSGIKYLSDTQVKETQNIEKFKGEWACYEEVDKSTPRIGKAGYSAYDSNLFTTATIHNSLAEIYLINPKLKEIPRMLALAMENINLYKNEDKDIPQYNFWQKLPIPTNLLGRGETVEDYPYLRRGNHFFLQGKFVWHASNVQDDADDTSLAFAAYKLNQEILGKNSFNSPQWMDENISYVFDNWRDKNRTNRNIYNVLFGGMRETGAFLTWLGPEGSFPGHHLLPFREQYIPFGANDVDCVVNTNVLGTLALFEEQQVSEGYEKSCKFVNNKIIKKQHRKCGVYYPNAYNFYYTAMRAVHSGAECLEESVPTISTEILKHQAANGSWDTDGKDKIQSTAYALGSLVNIKNPSEKIILAIEKGLKYLLSVSVKDEESGHISWEGGIFFSGGRVFRDRVSFRSTPYTTSLIIEVMTKYLFLKDALS